MHQDAETMRYLSGRTDIDAIRWRFERLTSDYDAGLGHWATVETATDRLVGTVGLLQQADWTATPYTIEVGWVIDRARWGRGYATEAGRASIDYARSIGIDRLISIIDPRNASSRRVAEKLGLQLGGETIWRERDVLWYETPA